MGKQIYFSDGELEELKLAVERKLDDSFTPSEFTNEKEKEDNRKAEERLNKLYEKLCK
jgi:hypothetical protein